jgi:N-acetylglucosamine-6-phosphate deacetylase
VRLEVEAALVRGELVPGDVAVADGVVVEVGLAPGVRGRIAVPGFVDLQVNGFAGVDFLGASTADYDRAGEALLAGGVTAYQPTFITAPESALIDALRALPANGTRPRVLGAHIEGPFLSPERLGTHPREHRREPDLALLDRLLEAGPVTELTLAPELPGAETLVARAVDAGVVVSAGHTNATAEQAHAAFDLGISTVTHIFNAMRPFAAREPGLAGAALVTDDVVVQVILDGVHLADDTARLVWQAAAGRVALVTDAIAAAHAGDGTYTIAGVDFEVEDGVARNAERVLAGSTVCMIDAVRNLVALGAPLEAALSAATALPARIAARPELGTLAPGTVADVVVLDDSLDIRRVLMHGEDVLG